MLHLLSEILRSLEVGPYHQFISNALSLCKARVGGLVEQINLAQELKLDAPPGCSHHSRAYGVLNFQGFSFSEAQKDHRESKASFLP